MQPFENFWNNLDEYSGKEFKTLIKKFSVQIAAKLIEHILSEEEIEIGYGWQGKKNCSHFSKAS